MIFSSKAQGDIFGQLPSLPGQIDNSMDWLGVFLGTLMMINLLAFVFNLLPLPPLDGWKITKQIIEKTTHKKINEKIEYWITIAIIILMLWIFVSGIVNDIIH
jgi:membrane-associated protease RseP (regulator of RpoE activity)